MSQNMFRSGWNSIDQFDLIEIELLSALSIRGGIYTWVLNTFYLKVMEWQGAWASTSDWSSQGFTPLTVLELLVNSG